MRAGLVVCAVAGCAPLLLACNAIWGIEPFDVYEGGAAGSSTSLSTSGPGGGGTSAGGSGGIAGSGGSGGAAPRSGWAIELEGGDDFVAFPDTAAFTPTSGFTWELWFQGSKLPAVSTDGRAQTLLGAMDNVGCEDIYLGFGSENSPENEIAFVVDGLGQCDQRDNNPVRFRPGNGFQDAQWYHLAAVADYAAHKTLLYLNGELVADEQRPFNPIDRSLMVHAGHWADGLSTMAPFTGRIDELRVYGAPLAAAKIQEHYGAGAGTYGDASEPLIAAGWHFDEGTGTQVTGYAGGINGTTQNGATWGEGFVLPP